MNRVGYGAMRLAGPGAWGPPDDPESARRVLRLAVELGVTFFDTANAYGPRTVNRLIGEALRPFPEGVIVGNKVGAGRGPDKSWTITDDPATVRAQVLEALADLGTEASDLTYLRLAGDTPGVAGSGVPWRNRSASSSSCATRGSSAASGCPARRRRCWPARSG